MIASIVSPRMLRMSLLVLAALSTTPASAVHHRDLGRETLAPENGWASTGTGVTGGSSAAPEHVYTVTNRQELVAALNDGVYPPPSSTPSNTPKIIYVQGVIDANVDDNNLPLSCIDYYRNGYTLEAFLATYDPAVWGRVPVTGPLESARIASQAAQQARVRIRVGSNTTIVGVGEKSMVRGAWFDIRGTAGVIDSRTNIIIRNLTFQDTYDCFPQWAPTDGALGSWNALYDAVSLRDTTHVWIDHNIFEDRSTVDALQPNHFGVLYQIHDGLLDITNASDFVTVSWNRFRNHDKVMLIGSSDTATADRGRLRVTLHHNVFDSVNQRSPRVRFGQVHVHNNFYDVRKSPNYQYSWGIGIESAIYAEENVFLGDRNFEVSRILAVFRGTAISATDTNVMGQRIRNPVDVVGAWNELNDPDLGFDAGWTPVLNRELLPAWTTPILTALFAGPFRW
jgi:pectate lyase